MSENDTAKSDELGANATKVLYEDDPVRIWDRRLAPGEKTAPHHHERDYVLVGVEPLPGHDPRFG